MPFSQVTTGTVTSRNFVLTSALATVDETTTRDFPLASADVATVAAFVVNAKPIWVSRLLTAKSPLPSVVFPTTNNAVAVLTRSCGRSVVVVAWAELKTAFGPVPPVDTRANSMVDRLRRFCERTTPVTSNSNHADVVLLVTETRPSSMGNVSGLLL